MFNRCLLIYKSSTDKGLTIGNNGSVYGYSDGREGGPFGNIEPKDIIFYGNTWKIKALYMDKHPVTKRAYMALYILWPGGTMPENLIISIITPSGDIMPDINLMYADWLDDVITYENMDDVSQFYELFMANVGNTVPCEIADAMPQP